ncbi:hypothetical protein GDO81_013921 [Engystomops pustulosus]|uniref:Ig-like domain-containing protein n=1 Tax=Engystomops pustulosus TaxID=76066 RepID=A0AAV7B6S4_ENGPU|nr:hypothetical protein GDO81_013921 [Engystomops pustulosus]
MAQKAKEDPGGSQKRNRDDIGGAALRIGATGGSPTSGAASIKLADLIGSDNGTYACEVNNPPDFSGSGSGIIQLSVLVPPTSPTCQSNGNTIKGQDATLTCSSTGNPPPIYTWTMVDNKNALLPGMMENQIMGSLLLTNLSEPMSGTYRCTASNEMGQATCQVTISVSSVSEAGAVAGAVIGVLLALIIIAARGLCSAQPAPPIYSSPCLMPPYWSQFMSCDQSDIISGPLAT